jgi:NAD(P)H-hydrate repair Nnr-like enzyme with NAD(P)H-hydrate epimerase domain
VVLDAVLGYGLHGNPAKRAAELIEWTDDVGVPIIALDARAAST